MIFFFLVNILSVYKTSCPLSLCYYGCLAQLRFRSHTPYKPAPLKCWIREQGGLAGIFVLGLLTGGERWWCHLSMSLFSPAALTLHGSLGWKDTCGSRTTPGRHHCSAPTTHQKEEIWNLKIGHCVSLFLNCLPCCLFVCLFVFPRIMIIKQTYSLGLVTVDIIFQNNGQECPFIEWNRMEGLYKSPK